MEQKGHKGSLQTCQVTDRPVFAISAWRSADAAATTGPASGSAASVSNALHCDLYGSAGAAAVARDLLPPDGVKRCREELEKKADLRQYTTSAAMDDLDEVRAWLGYETIDLHAGSYGTKAAQVYLRHYGRRVRAAVLDGIAPVDDPAPLLYARAGQRAVDLLLGECMAEEACRQAFPNLREELAAVMKKIDEGVRVTVADPRTQSPVEVQPNRGLVAEGIRYMRCAAQAREVPLLIHQAFQGDLVPLVSVALGRRTVLSGLIDIGAFLTVTCAEEVPFIEESAVARETAGTLLGDFRIREQQRACALWPRGTVPAADRELVRSEVPVLLFSGERDPVTPPDFGDRVAAKLPNSLHVVAPHTGHGSEGACAEGIVVRFLESGSVQGLDASCLRTAAPGPFVTSPSAHPL
jgi:pimeloyl-ACP methyl ester carboxylesterase